MSIEIGFKKLSEEAIIPTRAHKTDSGFDLYALEDTIIKPGETRIIQTGIAVDLPEGYEAQIRPKSGITAKTKLRVQLGTIDQDYTGELGVIVDNIYAEKRGLSSSIYTVDGGTTLLDGQAILQERKKEFVGSYLIEKGKQIAQLVVQKLPEVEAIEIDSLEETERGDGGFGSTGV